MKPHTKEELQTPSRAKGSSTLGPGHDGGPKPGFYATGDHGQANHHSPGDARAGDNFLHRDIARSGKPKNLAPVPHSWGNTPTQIASERYGGLGHQTSTAIHNAAQAESSALSPIDKGKTLSPPKAAFGMRSRADECYQEPCTNGRSPAHDRNVGKGVEVEVAKRIIAQALKN